MNKLVLVLFSFILFSGLAFAAPCGVNNVVIVINNPLANDYFTIGDTFDFELNVNTLATPPCDTDLEFRYDAGTSGVSFVRIKDNSPFDPPGTDYIEAQDLPGNITSYPIFTIPGPVLESVSLTCNQVGTYILQGYSSEMFMGANPEVTIHCVANSPPTGHFLVPEFDTILYKKDNDDDGDPDDAPFNYDISWFAEDAEGDTLTYDLEVFQEGDPTPPYFSDSDILSPYSVPISDFGKYTFTAYLKDTASPPNVTAIYSQSLFVKEQIFSTLSIEDLNVFPDSLHGGDKIYVGVTVRNNSPDTVDINVLFKFKDFPGEDYAPPGCGTCTQANVPPFSKATLTIPVGGHTLSEMDPGDYNIYIIIKENVVGSNTIRNKVHSFGHFVVVQRTRTVSVPETNFISIVLISLAVLMMTRKKKND